MHVQPRFFPGEEIEQAVAIPKNGRTHTGKLTICPVFQCERFAFIPGCSLRSYAALIFMLRAGIVGLPNVGKSTLFNAVTRTRKAEAANYPFCTIDPNVGIVTVPDARMYELQKIARTNVVIPAVIEFVDIAGLVKGASRGEGLGNKFLTHIREVDAIVQVVRCFEDGDIHHVAGSIDPVRDIEVINTELILADLESVKKRRERIAKDVKRGDKAAAAEDAVLAKIEPVLDAGKLALSVKLTPEEKALSKPFFLLTDKPTIFACNVKEGELAQGDQNPYVRKVNEYVKTHLACEAVVISAQIESDLVDLTAEEAQAFLKELGVEESGMGALIRATYHLLGLRTYFTAGEKEVRAWTIHAGDTAPKAAGVIHSDFERGFIKAETVAYEDLIKCGSVATAREKGLYRMEGKEYVVKDGDVLLFKFNV
jgi:ribosome-binding ATPase